jgi:transcriptional regulator with XRE-family HTH domain
MYDNSMTGERTISQQLRKRRKALGLSLGEVARRAGTSAATLSRYENGWTRFQTHTLRKLACALDCDLSIVLRPRAAEPSRPRSRPAAAIRRLDRLFWDHRLTRADLEQHPVWVAERVLDYGTLDDVCTLRNLLGQRVFLDAAAAANRVSPRTRRLWQSILELEGIPCTKAYSRNTAWNS